MLPSVSGQSGSSMCLLSMQQLGYAGFPAKFWNLDALRSLLRPLLDQNSGQTTVATCRRQTFTTNNYTKVIMATQLICDSTTNTKPSLMYLCMTHELSIMKLKLHRKTSYSLQHIYDSATNTEPINKICM